MDIHYMAYWLNGNGTEDMMSPDLPLSDAKVVREMNGVGRLTGTLPAKYGELTAFSERPIIKDWATAIYVEIDGEMFDGFIVAETRGDNEKLLVDAVGFVGYASGQPWPDREESREWSNATVTTPIAALWEKVQEPWAANINLKLNFGGHEFTKVGVTETDWPVPDYPTGRPTNGNGTTPQPKAPKYPPYPTSGSAAWRKKEYNRRMKAYQEDYRQYQSDLMGWKNRDAAYRALLRAYEERVRNWTSYIEERSRAIDAAKVKMNYWKTHDLLNTFQGLIEEAGCIYRVEHTRSGKDVEHVLKVRPNSTVNRREDVRFIEGENVYSIPPVTHGGDSRINSVTVLGAGEGPTLRWAQKSRQRGFDQGLRRAAVYVDKSLDRNGPTNARANALLRIYSDPIDIGEFIVIDHDLAPFRSFDVGDEVHLQTVGRRDGDINRWVTVRTITLDAETGQMAVKVSPSEQE